MTVPHLWYSHSSFFTTINTHLSILLISQHGWILSDFPVNTGIYWHLLTAVAEPLCIGHKASYYFLTQTFMSGPLIIWLKAHVIYLWSLLSHVLGQLLPNWLVFRLNKSLFHEEHAFPRNLTNDMMTRIWICSLQCLLLQQFMTQATQHSPGIRRTRLSKVSYRAVNVNLSSM